MNDILETFDAWLDHHGPAALVLREHLMPVEGQDGVLFPATFAASEDKIFKGGYNVNTFADGKNICLIDSVGSQANRIEPLFARERYARLVPQVVIKAGTKRVNLLNAGHRAGDAIVRCSDLQQELMEAFQELQRGNAEPLAKIAPTSIVFGAWDSRGTQAKLPRLIASTIRAFDVRELTRSAVYVPPVEYIAEELIDKAEVEKTEKDAELETRIPARVGLLETWRRNRHRRYSPRCVTPSCGIAASGSGRGSAEGARTQAVCSRSCINSVYLSSFRLSPAGVQSSP